MNKSEVVDVLSALASGVHPGTGEPFAEDSPYNDPKIIRALFGSLELIQTPAHRLPRKSIQEINREEGRPLRSNMRWTEEEDRELLAQIEKGTPTADIAAQFERTQGAIHSRLQRQGLLEREELLNSDDAKILEIVRGRLVAKADEERSSSGQA